MAKVKLTEIPIELKSHILSKLCTSPLASSEAPTYCTVDTSTWSLDAFPDDVLHFAQASTELSEAVIYTFGSDAKIMNFYRSQRLSEWIPLFRKQIRALSLSGLPSLHFLTLADEMIKLSDSRHDNIIKTLKALYNNDVALVALNLEDLTATDPVKAEEVAQHVINAIQKSSPSLKEIALHINSATVIAVPLVTLPNLEMAQISSDDFDFPSSAKALGDILKGISGHADRRSNISTVRELRLYNIHGSPILHLESCSSLFSAVQKLTIMCTNNSKSSEIAIFIANFRNLKKLQWYTGWICSEDMKNIFAGCPDLENLNIYTGQRHILPGDIDLAQNTPALKDLFISFCGKQQGLDFSAYLTLDQIKSLGENSPNLRTLAMEIDSRNVAALPLLLGTHCHKLQELRLLYSNQAIDCFGQDGWPAFAQGICSASDELHAISLVGDRTGPMIESATHEMVEAIVDILEFMGDRAVYVVFRVPINTHNPFIVLEALWRTLNVAKMRCKSIQTLCLDFIQDYSFGGYWVDDAQEDHLIEFFRRVSELRKDFFASRSGNQVNLGDVDALWEQQGWGAEDEEAVDQDMDNGPDDQAGDGLILEFPLVV